MPVSSPGPFLFLQRSDHSSITRVNTDIVTQVIIGPNLILSQWLTDTSLNMVECLIDHPSIRNRVLQPTSASSATSFDTLSRLPGVGLPEPRRYFPVTRGRFELTPGLTRLDQDDTDQSQTVFELDSRWWQYHSQKLTARRERLGKYIQTLNLDPDVERALHRQMIERMTGEHPQLFSLEQSNARHQILHSTLSGESLIFSDAYQFLGCSIKEGHGPGYVSGLDALACQLQEDFAVLELNPDGTDRVSALHLCFPNHWAAEDKIGQSFLQAHQPVPHFETHNRNSSALLQMLATRGPLQRFAWGVASDRRLNHHPQAPTDMDEAVWHGRQYDHDDELYLRVERQICNPILEQRALLFSIRTYFLPFNELDFHERHNLANAIQQMDTVTLRYKGLAHSRDAVLRRLADG